MTDTAKTAHPIVAPKKLIEVALPLDEINKASAREKSIRHGHPSTLHLWWARRPLAAARAVLFAQMVNDPSWKYSEEELKKPQVRSAITRKRNELFKLITQLVQWENTNNEEVLSKARAAIRESWRETCEANKKHPEAKTLFNPDKLPPFHDPFAGGGSIPLEAQRLGLEAHASDLNPVAVLINKAMIEIPPKFAGRPPVGPLPPREKQTKSRPTEDWSGVRGLAEDVKRYGAWMREEAFKRIGHLYPKVKITNEMVTERPDLAKYQGKQLTVIAWLWTRTVACSNPACERNTPLLSSFVLATKTGKERFLHLARKGNDVLFEVRAGKLSDSMKNGLKRGMSGIFECAHCGSVTARDYVAKEGMAGRIGTRLTAAVAEGETERVYISPHHVNLPATFPKINETGLDIELSPNPRDVWCRNFGLLRPIDLFTRRQLVSLTTLADLVAEARAVAITDARKAGMADDSRSLDQGGLGAAAYGDAISLYLAFVVDKTAEALSTLCTWSSAAKNELVVSTFRRHALPMTWDFAEANPFGESSGSLVKVISYTAESVSALVGSGNGTASQDDARTLDCHGRVFSTDPPYYDNIGYSDISDYFYVWLKKSISGIFSGLFSTLITPKNDELVALSYRHKNREEAEDYFWRGMRSAMHRVAQSAHPAIPMTLYYAFKQAETSGSGDTASTGWETFLEGVRQSELSVVGTWPVRTERSGRSIEIGTNALASSIVLVCRPSNRDAVPVARRDFLRELEHSLGSALADMTEDPIASIAPVDLAQAAIGPGMAIFSKYKAVLEADGSPMSVHNALIHINKAIDDYFAQAEGDMDADTRFCIGWFQQYEYEVGPFGQADVLARAKGTSVEGVRDAGVLHASKGEVRLLRVKEYPASWDPTKDSRLPIWEACHQMCRALGESESEAGALLARMPDKQDAIRQLAYRLYTICERKGWAEDARAYNELVTSWPAIVEESLKAGHKGSQMNLL